MEWSGRAAAELPRSSAPQSTHHYHHLPTPGSVAAMVILIS